MNADFIIAAVRKHGKRNNNLKCENFMGDTVLPDVCLELENCSILIEDSEIGDIYIKYKDKNLRWWGWMYDNECLPAYKELIEFIRNKDPGMLVDLL